MPMVFVVISRYRYRYLDNAIIFKPERSNAFHSIETILAVTLENECLEAYFWEQSDVPYTWNGYWTESAREGESLDINDPVFGQHWTRNIEAHRWCPCNS